MTVIRQGDFPSYNVPDDKIRKEADFHVKKISLIAYNGKPHEVSLLRMSLEIQEDLFNHCITGQMTFVDSVDLLQLLPVVGEETLEIVFTRPDAEGVTAQETDSGKLLEDVKVSFRVYTIVKREPRNTKQQIYTLHFVSKEFVQNFKQKVFLAFQDELYSKMAEVIYNEHLMVGKPINIEKSKFEQDFCFSNLTPLEALQLIASRAISAEGNGTAYVFYEDRFKFNWVTLGKLLTQSPVQTYIYQPADILSDQEQSQYRPRTIDSDIRAVENFGHTGGFNVMRNLVDGMYASRLLTFDTVRQIWEETDYDYLKDFDKFKHLHDNKVCTEGLDALGSPLASMRFAPTNKDHDKIPWIAGKEPGIKPTHIEEQLLFRMSQMKQIRAHKIGLTVSGDPRRFVGQVIEFNLPQFLGNVRPEAPQELDKYLQGKYLIISMKHRLEVDRYYQEMEIVKDTYFKGIAYEDPVEIYKPVW